MKRVLIASFDMEVGGVEKSLASMLEQFDYENYEVDMMLYSQTGDFMGLIPRDKVNLLDEIEDYTTFRKSIKQIIKERNYKMAYSRLVAILMAELYTKVKHLGVACYYQMQLMWKYALPFLPRLEKQYDVAISYLWPHYFVSEKVKAKTKIAWIHTDYSNLETEPKEDLKMWKQYNHIIAVSQACRQSFLIKYPSLKEKVSVIENIIEPNVIREMANEPIEYMQESEFKILSVARFSYAKGIDQAIEALALLHEKGYTQIKWYVVGYGGDEAQLKQMIQARGLEDSFILLGKRLNPYAYMKACDLYVQPSRYEGKAVTVLEAQILMKPVLITRYPTASSQIKEGIDGYICDLRVEALAESIEKFYKDSSLGIKLSQQCKATDFGNSNELNKLYKLFKD